MSHGRSAQKHRRKFADVAINPPNTQPLPNDAQSRRTPSAMPRSPKAVFHRPDQQLYFERAENLKQPRQTGYQSPSVLAVIVLTDDRSRSRGINRIKSISSAPAGRRRSHQGSTIATAMAIFVPINIIPVWRSPPGWIIEYRTSVAPASEK